MKKTEFFFTTECIWHKEEIHQEEDIGCPAMRVVSYGMKAEVSGVQLPFPPTSE